MYVIAIHESSKWSFYFQKREYPVSKSIKRVMYLPNDFRSILLHFANGMFQFQNIQFHFEIIQVLEATYLFK